MPSDECVAGVNFKPLTTAPLATFTAKTARPA